ncbi:MAG: acetyl-CoA carboxylase biotin carboxyl carrier protein subunit [Anaerolineaceae bacterium]|nr:acetyl-CoA carboxylase biotin carboxyl carrier protein subunit [Anaerolineaceae bacterium]
MKLRVKVDQQTFDVEVGSLNESPIHVTVDGDSFEVWAEEASSRSLPSAVVPSSLPHVLPASAPAVDKTKTVLAPIPGVILSILVKSGDSVVFGQELCILEAMKMKNQIRANRAGTIAAVRVSPGEQVRHSQVLLEYAD